VGQTSAAGPDSVIRQCRLDVRFGRKRTRLGAIYEQYGYRARAAARFSEAAGALIDQRRAHFTVVVAAIEAGRAEILRLHRTGLIHDTVLHALEQELDLEEMSARRHLGEP
jgi:hypothetical protein